MDLRSTGKNKTNHKKGIAGALRAQKRDEAETRNADYAKIPLDEKLKRVGKKERDKLAKKTVEKLSMSSKYGIFGNGEPMGNKE